jgi:hypothetical protein
MITSDEQTQTGAWAWGTRRTVQSPWRGQRESLARIAGQHCARNRNLFGQRRDALAHFAVGHAQRIVLCSITASANAERESPRSDRVERRRNLRGERWMPLRNVEHQRADMQIRAQCQCGGGEACCLKHRSIWRTTPHQVIPDPEPINRCCRQERSGAQPGISPEADGAEGDADWEWRSSRHV